RDAQQRARPPPELEHGKPTQSIVVAPCDRRTGELGERNREQAVAAVQLECVSEQLEAPRVDRPVVAPYDRVASLHAPNRRTHACFGRRAHAADVLRLSTDLATGRCNVSAVPDTIRVLIVDDHAVVRSGLRLLLDQEPAIESVGEAGTGREAVFQSRSLKPDVILMDVVMPDQTGLDVLPALLHEQPDAKVLMLSMQDDPRYVREAFAAGASGYVLKEAADAEVVAAVREVARGGRYVNPELGARLVAAEAEAARREDEDPLSEREGEVLRLLAPGPTKQKI